MTNGCPHRPSSNIKGSKVESFIEGPSSTSKSCVVNSNCDQSFIFKVRNFHLYDIDITVEASSMSGGVETCMDSANSREEKQWEIRGTVPAAPYKPSRGEPSYREKRLGRRIHNADGDLAWQEYIYVQYFVTSSENGKINGLPFNYPVVRFS
jgi:hypothetical protein